MATAGAVSADWIRSAILEERIDDLQAPSIRPALWTLPLDNWGNTAIGLAIEKGKINVLGALLSMAGADVNVRNASGWTPLMVAVEVGMPKAIEMLVAKGADETIRLEDKRGYTVVHQAAALDKPTCLEVLLGALANAYGPQRASKAAQISDELNMRPIHTAACHGGLDACRVLLQHGAAAAAVTLDGNNCLHYLAVSKNIIRRPNEVDPSDLPLWRALRDAGARESQVSKMGYTPREKYFESVCKKIAKKAAAVGLADHPDLDSFPVLCAYLRRHSALDDGDLGSFADMDDEAIVRMAFDLGPLDQRQPILCALAYTLRRARSHTLQSTIVGSLAGLELRLGSAHTIAEHEHAVVINLAERVIPSLLMDGGNGAIDKSRTEVVDSFDADGRVASQSISLYCGKRLEASLCILQPGTHTCFRMHRGITVTAVGVIGSVDHQVLNIDQEPARQFKFAEQIHDVEDRPLSDPRDVYGKLMVSTSSTVGPQRLWEVEEHNIYTLHCAQFAVLLWLTVRADVAVAPNTIYLWTNRQRQPRGMAGPPLHPQSRHGGIRAYLQKLAGVYHDHVQAPLINDAFLASTRNAYASYIQNQCAALAAVVRQRTPKKLWESDCVDVATLGRSLAFWIQVGGHLNPTKRAENIKNDEVLVMQRLVIYDDDTVQIRLHLFPNAAETYIHNHRTNFISYALFGSYRHVRWDIDKRNASSFYYQRDRAPNGSLSPRKRRPGQLKEGSSFTHNVDNTYYLESQTFHTVTVNDTIAETPMMTLLVRDSVRNGGTSVLEPVGGTARTTAPPPKESTEELIEGDAKAQLLEKMEHYLRQASKLLSVIVAQPGWE